jgi:hypothetical protein
MVRQRARFRVASVGGVLCCPCQCCVTCTGKLIDRGWMDFVTWRDDMHCVSGMIHGGWRHVVGQGFSPAKIATVAQGRL